MAGASLFFRARATCEQSARGLTSELREASQFFQDLVGVAAVVHVATVHWNDARWIDIQQRYLTAHLSEEFRVYAFLNGIDDADIYRKSFFYVSTEPIQSHPVKLNFLADIVIAHGYDDDDLLMFVDGDAFPIGDIAGFARAKLAEFPLIAVQRLENDGDVQPHPCFCITTVGCWKELGGDWKSGHQWKNAFGVATTDVGGNLLGQLERADIRWLPLLRSNRVNLHPLWFGVYHDLVYHHGAAFRDPWSRLDFRDVVDLATLPYTAQIKTKVIANLSRRLKLHWLDRYCPVRRRFDAMLEQNRKLISDMFERVQQDPQFYESLVGSGAAVSELPARDPSISQ
jgi:hypothetical protein